MGTAQPLPLLPWHLSVLNYQLALPLCLAPRAPTALRARSMTPRGGAGAAKRTVHQRGGGPELADAHEHLCVSDKSEGASSKGWPLSSSHTTPCRWSGRKEELLQHTSLLWPPLTDLPPPLCPRAIERSQLQDGRRAGSVCGRECGGAWTAGIGRAGPGHVRHDEVLGLACLCLLVVCQEHTGHRGTGQRAGIRARPPPAERSRRRHRHRCLCC
jgi:hypothetical protein